MPDHVVERVSEALNGRGKAVRGARIMMCGVTYKRDVDDVRESPALDIIETLTKRGAIVAYHDNHVPRLEHNNTILHNQPLDQVSEFDCVVITTDHSDVDYRALVEKARLVVDTRNATKAVRGVFAERIILL
jgi:UDP-N-acetyl-D-glucosamine dehydrogenase